MHLFFIAQSLSLTLEFCLYTISREQSNIKFLLEALMLSGISSLCIPFLSFSHIVMALDYIPPPQTLFVVGHTIFTLSVHPWHFGFFLISWKRSDGYSSISTDTLISVRPILLELLPFVKFLNAVKSLCAHYLFNQWLEFDQTSTDTSLGRGKEVIRFWWPWPYFQGHYIIKPQKVSLVCTLSH